MTSKKTIAVRIDRSLANELKSNFPGVRSSDLIRMMYKTSLLNVENRLRVIDKKYQSKRENKRKSQKGFDIEGFGGDDL